jgi:hypothetical protein
LARQTYREIEGAGMKARNLDSLRLNTSGVQRIE